ncbi:MULTISPECIES: ABC transporter ATP-binding protein [Agrobacterium]|jgi:oligopeptide transport system ATP-binding protein|uniref:ABC transporter ATP-binding protein n=1 Tax=Agrobacterium TaxID=357 RepID=UPI00036E0100|nr:MULTISPECIES: ABC transporter ATP-binding protein [Agrobacterium]UXS98427.1 ABC transporter ATP-binding protein [Agrobacterium tumefaciens]UXT83077.1 ABC transporter ATP-binding protein [Agrobacterium tumefaciens]WCK68015.1 ABC transporter ATP-binding protein [Agrobacterium tumefaciens]CUX03808.1 putative oligopeptide transport protein (ABC superfamily, atp_bind) [Agrobacterium fabacearum S56]
MNTTSENILTVRNLKVDFTTPDGTVNAVKGVDLHVKQGETLAVVGESGSGKSQTMMGIMGLLSSNGVIQGSAQYRGRELVGLPVNELNKIRGAKITMIFQEPMTSLDPLYRIGAQIAEPIVHHRGGSKKEARARVLELLKLVGIPDPERRIDSYPHELSGGQRQRVMIAMALANEPDILIADEPTTALDVTIQAQILDLLKSLQQRFGMAVVLITHDLGVVRHFADRVAVMRRGEIVETGPTEEIFERPKADYTRMLLDAEPSGHKPPVGKEAPVVLSGQNVTIDYVIPGGFLSKSRAFRAVDSVNVSLHQGQTIGIVGESGSGKSTLGRALLRLVTAEGRIFFGKTEITGLGRTAMRPLRRQLQLVFQDPYGSLSPRQTVGEIITEGLFVHDPQLSRAQRDERAIEALKEVGLDPAARNRYPHEFSGGQRQRIAIARAIILKPDVVILDEPTSALDRSIQGQVIDLLRNLQKTHNLSYIFISHDLSVIKAISDYVIVMRNGKIVEEGETDAIFERPAAEYTRTLIKSAFSAEVTS